MKKITVLALAACMAFAVAVPAMAVDVDFSGYYRVRGFMNSNITLNDQMEESEAYYDNRFRLQTVFKATDAVSVTTRIDALDDNQWGAQNEGSIDWDRVYMTIMSDVGMFMIGHQQAGVWGCDFFDDDYNDDRIKYVGRTGDFIFGAIIQKTGEYDSNSAWGADGESDADLDVYYLFGTLKQEGLEAGLLAAYARDASDVNPLFAFGGPGVMTKYALLPYGKFTAGPLSVRGEIIYEFGEMDYDGSTTDVDIDALSYALEGSFSLDMARLYLGWVAVSGQENSNDMTMGNVSYAGLGDDFNPLAILTDDLGGKMLNSNDLTVMACGVNLLYAGADVAVNDQLSVCGIVGYAMADEDWAFAGSTIDDEYGTEIDVTVKYQIMDNLEYQATLAYLMTGDLLGASKGVAPTNVDDNFGIMHMIKASF